MRAFLHKVWVGSWVALGLLGVVFPDAEGLICVVAICLMAPAGYFLHYWRAE